MSTYQTSYQEGEQRNGHSFVAVPPEFREECPACAEVLGGIPASDGQTQPIDAASLIIFMEEGKLKFCINPKGGPRIAFGCVGHPEKGLNAIEHEIALGRFEWKRRAGRKYS